MTIEEIPKKYKHICDCCGKEEITNYSSRPTYWCGVTVHHIGYEGNIAVGGYNEERSFCHKCFENFKGLFENFMNEGRE